VRDISSSSEFESAHSSPTSPDEASSQANDDSSASAASAPAMPPVGTVLGSATADPGAGVTRTMPQMRRANLSRNHDDHSSWSSWTSVPAAPVLAPPGLASPTPPSDFIRRPQTDRQCEVCSHRGPWRECDCQTRKWLAAARGWQVWGQRGIERIQCPTCQGARAGEVQRHRAIADFVCRLCREEAVQ